MTRAEAVAATASAMLAMLQPPPFGKRTLVVYHVDDRVQTYAALTPDALLNFHGVHVHRETGSAAIAAANAAVDAARAVLHPATAGFDARWGLRFLTVTGRADHSVYLDAFGRRGLIDGNAVTFRNGAELVAFLASRFGPA